MEGDTPPNTGRRIGDERTGSPIVATSGVPWSNGTAGCQFGENCHFLHYVPGGYNAVAHMMNLAPAPGPAHRPSPVPLPIQNGSAPSAVKTKLCNRFKSAEGCKFNDKCNFAHGEWELGKPIVHQSYQEDPRFIPGPFGARANPPLQGPASTFGASATAKISVAASLAGAVIGKGGVNSKQIYRQTGVKLSVRDHETDPNARNIELEGTFEQIERAGAMVREVIASVSSVFGPGKAGGVSVGAASIGNSFKTKLCEKFSRGSCTFGERCHFAHGASELRKTG
ncbi:hypothetical protein OROGR_023202 [Orobanche gracilis]